MSANDELCIRNEEFYIKHEELCRCAAWRSHLTDKKRLTAVQSRALNKLIRRKTSTAFLEWRDIVALRRRRISLQVKITTRFSSMRLEKGFYGWGIYLHNVRRKRAMLLKINKLGTILY